MKIENPLSNASHTDNANVVRPLGRVAAREISADELAQIAGGSGAGHTGTTLVWGTGGDLDRPF